MDSLFVWLIVLAASSSGSGCKDGWVTFRGSCYLFVDDILEEWSLAANHCASHSAHLVSIETADEDKFIRDQSRRLFKCGRNSTMSFWAGGTDDAVEGIWTWHDTDEPFAYYNWSPGQPQNRSGEDCLVLFGMHGFLWDDAYCTDKYHFICEQSDLLGEVVG